MTTKQRTTTKQGRSGDPRKAAAPARKIVTGEARRDEIRAELDAIAYSRRRVNKQLAELRVRQYQAVRDARDERMTYGEIGDLLGIAGATVCALKPPPGWQG